MGGLRVPLAISVVFSHMKSTHGLGFYPGNMAVEMFFMISGFYMSLILSKKYSTGSMAGIGNFYASRFFRLWPIFIITSAAVVAWWYAASIVLGHRPMSAGPVAEYLDNRFIEGLIYLSDVIMLGQDLPALFHVSADHVLKLTFGPGEALPDGSLSLVGFVNIGQAWSIGTEIWFYLLAPFFMRRSWVVLVLIMACCLVLRYAMDANGFMVYFFFPTQLPLFLAGMLGYRLNSRWINPTMAAVCLAVIFAGSIAFGAADAVDQSFKWVLYGFVALTIPAIFRLTRVSSVDRTIGELSYPIYITHILLQVMLAAVAKRLGFTPTVELLVVVVGCVSWILYVYVDRPVQAWRERFAKPPKAS